MSSPAPSRDVLEAAQNELLSLIEAGAARSTEKLKVISGCPWSIHIISVDVGSGERFRNIMARDKQEYFGVGFSSSGERYLIIFSEDSGRALVKSYFRDRAVGGGASGQAFERSCLSEIANILVAGLAGELAERQGMARIISAPKSVAGQKTDICNEIFGDLRSIKDDSMVNAFIHISSPALAADCTLMIRLDPVAANFLLNTEPTKNPAS